MPTFILLYGPGPGQRSERNPYIASVQAERIGTALREALAIEARLHGATLRAVWWAGKHPGELESPVNPENQMQDASRAKN